MSSFFRFQAIKCVLSSAIIKKACTRCLHDGYKRINRPQPLMMEKPYQVFIKHRGVDTKKNFAGLLYQYLSLLDVSCFLDSKSMNPGDRLLDNIELAIQGCKVGVAVLSPRYCESIHCLRELALMMEMKKRLVPIFYDVKPSQLCILSREACSKGDLHQYSWALEEVLKIVGLTFDPSEQDWSELLTDASKAVMKNLVEVEEESRP